MLLLLKRRLTVYTKTEIKIDSNFNLIILNVLTGDIVKMQILFFMNTSKVQPLNLVNDFSLW